MSFELVASPALRPRFRRLHQELRELGFTGERLEPLVLDHVKPLLGPGKADPYWARRSPIMFSPQHPVPVTDVIPDPLRILLRVFHEDTAVTWDELAAALSSSAIRTLVDAGMLSEDGALLVPNVSLTEWSGLLIASDRYDRVTKRDGVFRPNISTSLPSWFLPRGQAVAQAIDVGTGSGVLALLLRQRYQAEVHAVDPNPRAVQFCRFNLALNDIDGVNVAAGDHRALARESHLLGATDLLLWNMPDNFWEHEAQCWGFPSQTEGERVLVEIYEALPALLSPKGSAVIRHESRLPVSWFENMLAAIPGSEALQVLYVHEGRMHEERREMFEQFKDSWDEKVRMYDSSYVHGIAMIRRRIEPSAPRVSYLLFDQQEEIVSFRSSDWQERWSSLPGWSDYRIE